MINKKYLVSVILLIRFTIYGSSTDVPNLNTKNSIFTNNTVQVALKTDNKILEPTHSGREHVSKNLSQAISSNATTMKTAHMTNENQTSSNRLIIKDVKKNGTISESGEIQKNKNRFIPKIDKNFPVSTEKFQSTTTKPTSTVKIIAKKPLFTVHDEDADKTNSLVNEKNVPPSIMNFDPLLSEKKHNRSNYVVPIVAVILSVPLVAGLISIIYKKGKDWWLHRNYRRMDYLIEGLYNS